MDDPRRDAAEPSWHDNLVYGLFLQTADPARGKWRSNLLLDIDHILEWVCGADRSVKFLVAPTTLTFHDVTDLRIDVDFGASGFHRTINELSIADIEKEAVKVEGARGPRPYFRWRILLNLPQGGEIAFGASGYSQTFRAEAVLLDEQSLPADRRPPFVLIDP